MYFLLKNFFSPFSPSSLFSYLQTFISISGQKAKASFDGFYIILIWYCQIWPENETPMKTLAPAKLYCCWLFWLFVGSYWIMLVAPFSCSFVSVIKYICFWFLGWFCIVLDFCSNISPLKRCPPCSCKKRFRRRRRLINQM